MTDSEETTRPGVELVGPVAAFVVRTIRDKFRPEQSPQTNVPTACLLPCLPSLGLQSSFITGAPQVYLVFEGSARVFLTVPVDALAFISSKEPWEDYDLLISPTDFSWCVGFTHDDAVRSSIPM